MLIGIDCIIRRRRRTLFVLAATFSLAIAVALAHGIGAGHMDGMGGMNPVASICLAVAETAALGLALTFTATALRLGGPRAALLPWRMPARHQVLRPARTVPARAGPHVLQVFRL